MFKTVTLSLTRDQLLSRLNGQNADWFFQDAAETVITVHSDLGNAHTGPLPEFDVYEPNVDGLYEIEVLEDAAPTGVPDTSTAEILLDLLRTNGFQVMCVHPTAERPDGRLIVVDPRYGMFVANVSQRVLNDAFPELVLVEETERGRVYRAIPTVDPERRARHLDFKPLPYLTRLSDLTAKIAETDGNRVHVKGYDADQPEAWIETKTWEKIAAVDGGTFKTARERGELRLIAALGDETWWSTPLALTGPFVAERYEGEDE